MGKASVILCTYNRAAMLAGAIESLAAQTISPSRFEVLVVDNNSSDGTGDAVREARDRFPDLPLQYLAEARQGLGYARNAGCRAAAGDCLAFLDDDACAAPDWLEKGLEAIAGQSPPPLAVGGPIRPMYDAPRPAWFKDEYEERQWGTERRFLRAGESFSGSNLFLSRGVLERFGGFSENDGMEGERLAVGEETALFGRIWACGEGEGRLLYLPDLEVYHRVPAGKMTVGYRIRRSFAEGQADFRLRTGGGGVGTLRYRAGALWRIGSGMCRALGRLGAHRRRENWLVEEMRPVWSAAGSLWIGDAPRARRG